MNYSRFRVGVTLVHSIAAAKKNRKETEPRGLTTQRNESKEELAVTLRGLLIECRKSASAVRYSFRLM